MHRWMVNVWFPVLQELKITLVWTSVLDRHCCGSPAATRTGADKGPHEQLGGWCASAGKGACAEGLSGNFWLLVEWLFCIMDSWPNGYVDPSTWGEACFWFSAHTPKINK